jgi:hypothetical protein
MPYDQATAHEIGTYLGIHPRDIPCITFFQSIHDSQLVIYRLDNSWTDLELTEELRELFSFKDWERRITARSVRREDQRRRESRVAVHPLAKSVKDRFEEILDRLPNILQSGGVTIVSVGEIFAYRNSSFLSLCRFHRSWLFPDTILWCLCTGTT